MTECQNCGAPAELYLCSEDGRRLRKMLAELPELLDALEAAGVGDVAFGPIATVARERPETEDEEESPLGFNAAAFDCKRKLEYHLMSLQPWFGGRADIAWLTKHFVQIMRIEVAGAFYGKLESLSRRGWELVDRPEAPVYRGPCPTPTGTDARGETTICGTSLYGERHDPRVTCARCRETYDVGEIEESLLDSVDDYRWTATEILRLMRELGEPVGRSTFYRWVGQHRLVPSGYLHDGRVVEVRIGDDPPLYKLADVRALRTETAAKKGDK